MSASPLGEGHYLVTFPAGAFSEVPIVTVSVFNPGAGSPHHAVLEDVTAANFELYIRSNAGNRRDKSFNFIAIGER